MAEGEFDRRPDVATARGAGARRLGFRSAVAVVGLELVYGCALAAGLLSLASPEDPIAGPIFTLLEILILAIAPLMVALMAAVHLWAAPGDKARTLVALAFMILVAGVTSCVHFTILTLSRQELFAAEPWTPLVLSFRWPSIAYALDILAWDVFFPLSMLGAAPAFRRGRLERAIRMLMIASAVLSLAGLAGVALGDMRVRSLGVAGYVVVFAVVAALLAVLFRRRQPTLGREGPPTAGTIGKGGMAG